MRDLSRGAMARRAATGLVSRARCGIALAAVVASAAPTQAQAVRITGITIVMIARSLGTEAGRQGG